MPLTAINYKQEKALDGMVTFEIFGFRNVKRDVEAQALAQRIQEETGRAEDGAFPLYYSQRLMYTDNVYFQWHPDAPPEFKNLETFWKMHSEGESAAEVYLWYIDNISNFVSNQWSDALERAHKIWKPPEQKDPNKMAAELKEQGLEADPN